MDFWDEKTEQKTVTVNLLMDDGGVVNSEDIMKYVNGELYPNIYEKGEKHYGRTWIYSYS